MKKKEINFNQMDNPCYKVGKVKTKIPYGWEKRINFMENNLLCHDCKVKIGQYHKKDCGVEECSNCGRQKLSCGCK